MSLDILIPSKNPNKNLFKTIESINNIEEIQNIIIVDDTNDLNHNIYKSIKKKYKKIILLNNKHLPGISGALNTGLEYSKSEFIGRIDSGDICLDKKRFEKILNLFKKKINIDLICSGLVNHKNKKITPNCIYIKAILSPFSRVPHPTWVMRKSSIIANYKHNCTRFEDYAFLLDNGLKVLILNQFDLLYDTSDDLSRLVEFRTLYLKTKFFLRKSEKDLNSLTTALFYLILRTIRLILSSKKIYF